MNQTHGTSSDQEESLDLRIKRLEENYEQGHRFFTHTLTVISIVFIFVGIIMTVLSVSSRNEINDAVREMERKFEVLSGNALKKPELTIRYEGKDLENQILTAKLKNKTNFSLSEILLKNIGNKSTESVSMRLYFNEKITEPNEPYWEQLKSFDDKFPVLFWSGHELKISPGEEWHTPPFSGKFSETSTRELSAKLMVYFGEENPTQVNFVIKLVE